MRDTLEPYIIFMALSSVWLERQSYKLCVESSNLSGPILFHFIFCNNHKDIKMNIEQRISGLKTAIKYTETAKEATKEVLKDTEYDGFKDIYSRYEDLIEHLNTLIDMFEEMLPEDPVSEYSGPLVKSLEYLSEVDRLTEKALEGTPLEEHKNIDCEIFDLINLTCDISNKLSSDS